MFIAYEVSLKAIRSLRVVVPLTAASDLDLADQLRRAASSVPLNLGEGSGRRGRDRKRVYRIAAGSAKEAVAALDLAIAWGLADETALAESRRHLDRVLRMIWPLIE